MPHTKQQSENQLTFQMNGACGSILLTTRRRVMLRNVLVTYAGRRMMFASCSKAVQGTVIHLLIENGIPFAY